jgi:hypothetical protein
MSKSHKKKISKCTIKNFLLFILFKKHMYEQETFEPTIDFMPWKSELADNFSSKYYTIQRSKFTIF